MASKRGGATLSIDARVEAIDKRVDAIEASSSATARLTTLAPDPYELIREIPVAIRPTGDDFIATFFDAGISASGDNEQEAFDNLRDILVGTLELLVSLPPERIGPHPRRQLEVLSGFVRRVAEDALGGDVRPLRAIDLD